MSMTKNERTQAAIPHQGIRILSCRAQFSLPRGNKVKKKSRREIKHHGEVMELCVQLKVCEGCGCLWYRSQTIESVYCLRCEEKLKEFPLPGSRKRRGRPCRKELVKVWAVAEAVGGAQ